MRISDWSSDVCSSDLQGRGREHDRGEGQDQALEGQALQAFGREESDRDAGRGPGRDRHHQRDLRAEQMALKNYKPTSPARRGLILVDKTQLWKGKPVKALTEGRSEERRAGKEMVSTGRYRGEPNH